MSMQWCPRNCPDRDSLECRAVEKVRDGVVVRMAWDCEYIQADLRRWERMREDGVELREGGER